MSRVNPVFRETLSHHQTQHAAFAAMRPDDPAWLIDLRATALARFTSLGFPSRQLEEWKSTSSAPIARVPFELAPIVDDPSPASVLSDSAGTVALVNGVCASQRSPRRSAAEPQAAIRAPHVITLRSRRVR